MNGPESAHPRDEKIRKLLTELLDGSTEAARSMLKLLIEDIESGRTPHPAALSFVLPGLKEIESRSKTKSARGGRLAPVLRKLGLLRAANRGRPLTQNERASRVEAARQVFALPHGPGRMAKAQRRAARETGLTPRQVRSAWEDYGPMILLAIDVVQGRKEPSTHPDGMTAQVARDCLGWLLERVVTARDNSTAAQPDIPSS